MIAAVVAQAGTPKWTKDQGQYIPNPATWLNEGRWQDEFPEPSSNGLAFGATPRTAGNYAALQRFIDRGQAS